MAEINYQRITMLTETTLPRVLGRPGDKHHIIHENAVKSVIGGRMLKRARFEHDGGLTIKFPVMFENADIVQPMGPYTKLTPRQTPAPSYGEAPMRFLGWMWYRPWVELHLNRGEKEVLQDILKLTKQSLGVNFVNYMENELWARDGNYLHDGVGSNDFLKFFGFRHLFTIDGLHISGDTTLGVLGIVPTASGGVRDAWRNGFISPVSSIDGLGTITSVYDLRRSLDRAMNFMRWDSLDVWGAATKDVDDASPTIDWDSEQKPEDLMICCDKRTSLDYRDIAFDREDQVGRDQGRGRPIYKRVEVIDTPKLGMNSYGYGFLDDGSAAWADRTGSYASGLWPSYGETMLFNMKHMMFAIHPQHAPRVKKAYEPEGMQGIAVEGDYWFQTMVTSRQRAGFYIGPYAYASAA